MAIERIHSANLVNFGIMPLIFVNPADYDKIEEADSILIENAREQLPSGKITATIVKADGNKCDIELTHKLSAEDVRIILAGGMLNC
jgi:aconitate hydratase